MKTRLILILSVLGFAGLTACNQSEQEPEIKQTNSNTDNEMSDMLSGKILTKVQNSLDDAVAISQQKLDFADDMVQDLEDRDAE